MIEPPDPIAISALQHWCYCPRQCALIHQEQTFVDNIHTARGQAVHRLVDLPGDVLKSGIKIERALPLWSERLGLIGKADLVEVHPNGTRFPVEFKHGRKRHALHDDLQLAAQALCLEEMLGRPVPKGAIYHASSRRRREVDIGPALREQVVQTVDAIRTMLNAERLPMPANDARCPACSLIEICQPELIAAYSNRVSALGDLYTVDDDS